MRPELITIDRAASTVEIAGRRFPAVTLICPLAPGQEDLGDLDRALGAGGDDQSVYVPAENGLLFSVEEHRTESHHGLELMVHGRTCELLRVGGEWMYLPWNVAFLDGELVAGKAKLWSWAEPEWVAEMIDRLAAKPFAQPPGEPCRIVALNYFKEAADA